MRVFLRRALNQALYGFPRLLLPARSVLEQLRERGFAERFRHKSTSVRVANVLFVTVAYPLMAVFESLRGFPRMRLRNPQVSWLEIPRMALAALLHNIPPTEYVNYEFDRVDARVQAADYLYWMDSPALLWMNRQREADNRDVQDKGRFALLCEKHGLSHVPTLAEFRDGRQISGEPISQMQETHLWVKPIDLNGSRGALGWVRDGDVYRSNAGSDLTQGQWLDYLCADKHIVQRWLRNHPALEPITNGTLAGIRLNIVLDRNGNADLLGATIGLPCGLNATSTTIVGAAIDPDTGEIIRTFHPFIDGSKGHPNTREPIVGRYVPLFREAVNLALRAHREAFPRFASLGWDVVIVPEGPVLLETNSGWSAIAQQVFFGPLGKTALARVAREELDLAG
jgi:hypothetical protein